MAEVKKLKDRTNEDLVELALQLYARTCRHPSSRELHKAAMAAKEELLRRVASHAPATAKSANFVSDHVYSGPSCTASGAPVDENSHLSSEKSDNSVTNKKLDPPATQPSEDMKPYTTTCDDPDVVAGECQNCGSVFHAAVVGGGASSGTAIEFTNNPVCLAHDLLAAIKYELDWGWAKDEMAKVLKPYVEVIASFRAEVERLNGLLGVVRKDRDGLIQEVNLLGSCPLCGQANYDKLQHKDGCKLEGYNLPQILGIAKESRENLLRAESAERELRERGEKKG